jgi:hypothetical protein
MFRTQISLPAVSAQALPTALEESMPVDHSPGDGLIRVLVADNTHIHTQLLSDALRRDRRLEIISGGPRSSDLVDTAAKNQTQVGVISCNLEGEPLRGLDVVRELRGALPEARNGGGRFSRRGPRNFQPNGIAGDSEQVCAGGARGADLGER